MRDHEFRSIFALNAGPVHFDFPPVVGSLSIEDGLFFDGTSADGLILRLGPSFDCAWGLDKGEYKVLDVP